MAENKDKPDLGLLDEPQEFVVKHGVFWYHEPDTVVGNDGLPREVLVERMAFHNEVVKLHRQVDINRGQKHDAFWSDEDVARIRKEGRIVGQNALPAGSGDAGASDVNVGELEDDELVDWLMSTGEFDGRKKPNAREVNEAVGDDSALAERVLQAENTAQGNEPRVEVEKHMTSVIDKQQSNA